MCYKITKTMLKRPEQKKNTSAYKGPFRPFGSHSGENEVMAVVST